MLKVWDKIFNINIKQISILFKKKLFLWILTKNNFSLLKYKNVKFHQKLTLNILGLISKTK